MGDMAGRFSFSSDRNRSTPWFRVGEVDVTTAVLVPALCVLSMFVWAINSSWLEPFVLIADDVRHGQVWRLVTWPLVNTPDSIWTIITIAIFWYFGREIEGLLGRNRFAWFLVILTVVPAIVAAIVGLNVSGLRYLELALILVFIAEFPQARFFFNIPGWVLGAVIVGLEVLQLVGTRNDEGLIFVLMLLVTAAIAARSFGLAATLHWIPQVPLPDALSGTRSSGPRRSAKGKVRGKGRKPSRPKRGVVEGPWAAPPAPNQPSPDAVAAQAELDRLLDKISASGLDSLTADEKRRLNELSKRLR
jgi:hypothetical protein